MPVTQTPPPEQRTAAPMMVRAAEVRPSSYQEADNSIAIVWTTGAAGMRVDWMDGSYYMEELSVDPAAVRLDRLNSGACLLDSHQDYTLDSVLGSVVPGTASVDGAQGVARVRLATTPDVADTNAKIIDGHIRFVSVGYNVYTYLRTEQPGEYPHLLATDWEPVELSMVSVPFDAGAQVRARSAERGGTHSCIIRGDAASTQKEPAMADEASTADVDTADTNTEQQQTEQRQERRQEAQHVSIDTITRRAKPQGAEFVVEMIERHAKAPMTELQLERAINDRYAREHNPPDVDNTIRVGADEADKWVEGAMHGIIARAGLAPLVEKAAKARGETLKITPGEFRSARLVSLATESLSRAGVKINTRDEEKIVETALRHAQQTRTAVISQSTSDFSVVLESTMNKVVQAAYSVTPDSWSRWAKTGSVTDFRDQNRYLLGTFGALDTVAETGEIKNKPIPDGAREKIKLGTRANMINLSRNAIVNDDLGAFSEMAIMLGRAAKLSIEKDAYALLNSNPTMASDGQALFSSAHGNIFTGTAGPPTVAGIDAMRVQIAQQLDLSGNEILDLSPTIWLGPLSLGSNVRVINNSAYDPDANNKLQRANPVAHIFNDVVDTGRLTGTAWYMFADPDMAPAFEVVFLNGDQEPKVDSQDGWRTLGVEWRVVFDYGMAAINWRSVIKNLGA